MICKATSNSARKTKTPPLTRLKLLQWPRRPAVSRETGWDVVSATWSATGSARLVHRVVLQVQVSATRSEWVVVPESGDGITHPAMKTATGSDKGKWLWQFDLTEFSTANYRLADDTGEITVTKAMLEEALTVRVESQNAVNRAGADADEWEASTNNGSVTAKP